MVLSHLCSHHKPASCLFSIDPDNGAQPPTCACPPVRLSVTPSVTSCAVADTRFTSTRPRQPTNLCMPVRPSVTPSVASCAVADGRPHLPHACRPLGCTRLSSRARDRSASAETQHPTPLPLVSLVPAPLWSFFVKKKGVPHTRCLVRPRTSRSGPWSASTSSRRSRSGARPT